MKRTKSLCMSGAAVLYAMSITSALHAERATPVELTRLDCGRFDNFDLSRFSDDYRYRNRPSYTLSNGCYLIRHGEDFLLWDAGFPVESVRKQKISTIVEQLAEIGLKPAQIGRVGISHYHFDHTGQVNNFPNAPLFLGKGDWDALSADPPNFGVNPASLEHWLTGGGKVEPVAGDKDIFGDGSVVMLNIPGHTPGHHALLVNLKKMGPVLLTGDLFQFGENYVGEGVPSYNANRADTLASFDRVKKLAKYLSATIIIQHEPADIGKLPKFPVPAK